MTNQKSMVEIIKETREYYDKDVNRRAIDESGCCFYHYMGKMCAVGRCLQDPRNFESDDAVDDYILENLKTPYKGHPIEFWEDLQSFHDTNLFWEELGISETGQKRYGYLLKAYC